MSPSPTQQTASPQKPGAAVLLGPHTGTEPLEVTLVLRRRAGAAWAPASWPQRPALAARAVRPAMRRGSGRPREPAALRPGARADRDRRRCRTPRAAPRGRLRRRSTSAFARDARPIPARRRARTFPRLRATRRRCRRRPSPCWGWTGARWRARTFAARAPRPRTYTPLELGQPVRLSAGHGRQRRRRRDHRARRWVSARVISRTTSAPRHRPAPAVTAVSVAGGSNAPGGEADAEVMLDIEVIGPLAPGCGHRRVFRAEHRPGVLRGDLAGRARCAAHIPGDVHQLGRPRGRLDRSVTRRHADRAGGRRGARGERDGRRRRQRLERWRERRPTARGFSRPRARTRSPAAARGSSASGGGSRARSCGTRRRPGRAPPAAGSARCSRCRPGRQTLGAGGAGRQRRARRARRGGQCRPADRLPGAGGWARRR